MTWHRLDANTLTWWCSTTSHAVWLRRYSPQASTVEIAEMIGAADWKDRGLDVAAETERLFDGLGASLQSHGAIAASLRSAAVSGSRMIGRCSPGSRTTP